MGNERSGKGQPTATDEESEDETSEGAVSTDEPAEGSVDDKAEDEAPETETPESDDSNGQASQAGEAAGPPGGGSTGGATASAPGQKPVFLAIVAVVALIVGLVVGLVVGGGSSDEDDTADEAASEGDSEGHEGHGGMEMGDEESGLAALLADHHYHEPTDEVIDSETRALLTAQLAPLDEYVKDFPTIADAEAAGWRRAGPFIPGLGTHYIRPEGEDVTFTIRESLDGDEDEGMEIRPVLIYDGLEDDAALVGFMPMAIGEEPGDFAGPYDTWHRHTNVCVVPGEEEGDPIDLPFVGDMESTTEERCESVGGNLNELTSHMVHIWSIPSYDSELGMFSEVNPKITCPDGAYHRVPYDELEPPYITTCPGE